MTSAVLDTSALLAMLLVEPGGVRVQKVITDASMSTINLGETVGLLTRQGFDLPAIRRLLDALPFDRVLFDEDQAYAAGLLLPLTRPAGLSLGDRACLALAAKLGVPALTADRAWSSVATAVGVDVQLIR
jgi:ribonuclease VapC